MLDFLPYLSTPNAYSADQTDAFGDPDGTDPDPAGQEIVLAETDR